MSGGAVLLMSGGLDGLLAACVLLERGVTVHPLHVDTGFVHESRRRSIDAVHSGRAAPALAPLAGRVARIDVRAAYVRAIRSPRHGYGVGMNPCHDCRPLMLRLALERAAPGDAVATGDVLGQRGLDQSRRAFETVDREAGAAGRVLRPLSAGLLAPPAAVPWAAVGAWPSLHGRGRRGQRELAARLGVPFEPVPSGGCCRLADPAFGRRLRDCLGHAGGPPSPDELARLARGRHVRLDWSCKVIVGRDEAENAWLEAHAGACWAARVADGRGALVLVEGEARGERLREVAAVAARYSADRAVDAVDVRVWRPDGGAPERILRAAPAGEARLRDGRL